MKTTFQRLAAAGAVCLGLTVAGAAVAQDRPAAPAPKAAARADRTAERDQMRADMQRNRQQRLHDLLQIKPDQEAAFRTYVSTLEQMRAQRAADRKPPAPGAAPLTTPERLDRMTQRLNERQQQQQKVVAATKTFYAALTPDQRKAFDAMPMMKRASFRDDGPGKRGKMMMRGPMQGPPPAPTR
jgi:hypothetical protein